MRLLRCAVPSIAVLFAAASSADEHHLKSPCEYSETRSGQFSSKDTSDTLFVGVSGNPCYSGSLRVVITNSNSTVLYEYSTSIRGLTAPPDTDEALREYVRSWVADTIERAFSQTSDSLRPFKEISWREEALVSETKYEAIRKRALPTLSHPAGEEGWLVIVADPSTGSIIPVLGGSM